MRDGVLKKKVAFFSGYCRLLQLKPTSKTPVGHYGDIAVKYSTGKGSAMLLTLLE